MKKERAKEIIDVALDTLAEQLANGKSDELNRYLRVMAAFHRYSFRNQLLIQVQKPDATHVAGFRIWKKLNRHVRKGETGILILAPMVQRAKANQDDAGHSEENSNDCLRGFKVAHVFDISQTEGTELPSCMEVRGTPGERLQTLKEMIRSSNIDLRYEQLPRAVQGLSIGGCICVRPNLTPAEEFATLAHEFAHELLHKGEENRRISKVVKETEAEAVAFVVCTAVGLDTNSASSDYIQIYRGTKETLAQSLEAIQKTSKRILDGLLT